MYDIDWSGLGFNEQVHRTEYSEKFRARLSSASRGLSIQAMARVLKGCTRLSLGRPNFHHITSINVEFEGRYAPI
jgi:hypothetical protein